MGNDVDGILETFRCMNDLLGILAVSLGAYSEEMLRSGAFTCENIFREYNDCSPFDERIDISRIESMLTNKKRCSLALGNLRCMIFRETVIYIYEMMRVAFRHKQYFRRIMSTPLVSIFSIIRNAVVHNTLKKRECDLKKIKFNTCGELKWNDVVVRKCDILKFDYLSTKIVSRTDQWKVINGIRDIISLESNGASGDEIIAFGMGV